MIENLNPIILWSFIGVIVFIYLPQAWREKNSFLVAIPKLFYLVIIPFMLGVLPTFLLFGPAYALIGLYDSKYTYVTYCYIYLILMAIFLYLAEKQKWNIEKW